MLFITIWLNVIIARASGRTTLTPHLGMRMYIPYQIFFSNTFLYHISFAIEQFSFILLI